MIFSLIILFVNKGISNHEFRDSVVLSYKTEELEEEFTSLYSYSRVDRENNTIYYSTDDIEEILKRANDQNIQEDIIEVYLRQDENSFSLQLANISITGLIAFYASITLLFVWKARSNDKLSISMVYKYFADNFVRLIMLTTLVIGFLSLISFAYEIKLVDYHSVLISVFVFITLFNLKSIRLNETRDKSIEKDLQLSYLSDKFIYGIWGMVMASVTIAMGLNFTMSGLILFTSVGLSYYLAKTRSIFK